MFKLSKSLSFSTAERVAGLESAIKDLEFQLTEQEESASSVIAKWQESCNALEEKNAELLSSLESFGPGEVISKEALLELQNRLRQTEEALAKAKENLRDDDDVVLHWQGAYSSLRGMSGQYSRVHTALTLVLIRGVATSERVAQLETASKDFVTQMGQQEEEAKAAISKWQESCSTLEAASQQLSQELEASHDREHALGVQLQETQKELESAKASLKEDEESLAKWQGELIIDGRKTAFAIKCLFFHFHL